MWGKLCFPASPHRSFDTWRPLIYTVDMLWMYKASCQVVLYAPCSVLPQVPCFQLTLPCNSGYIPAEGLWELAASEKPYISPVAVLQSISLCGSGSLLCGFLQQPLNYCWLATVCAVSLWMFPVQKNCQKETMFVQKPYQLKVIIFPYVSPLT